MIDDVPSGMKRGLARFRQAFCLLIVATAGLLAWQHYGMERVIEIDGSNALRVEAGDDREGGGASVASLQRDGSSLRMRCELSKQKEWPYCRLRLFLGYEGKGIDLSQFESFSLDLKYETTQPRLVRVYLINHEEGLSHPGDFMSNRVNELDRVPIPESGTARFPMNVFYTAPYWKDEQHIPLEKTGARYDNVFGVDLLNSATSSPAPYVMTLKAIRFHGKWISQTHLLMALVSLWILFAVSWPLTAAYHLRTKLIKSRVRLQVMQEVQDALKAEARELADQAHQDPLTRALNREGLHAALAKSPPSAEAPLSVVFADIDHFKRINDTQGHATGDAVLKHFAMLMSSLVRSSDKVVRWGGEEFLIFCDRTELRQAALLAEQLRSHMQAAAWPAGLKITASFGVAQYQAPESLDETIARADEQLYMAKEGGRNRVYANGTPLIAADGALPYRPA